MLTSFAELLCMVNPCMFRSTGKMSGLICSSTQGLCLDVLASGFAWPTAQTLCCGALSLLWLVVER
ncbi:hypothetical protein RchiOBHm_Chr5g0056901 [Rosa chinensis]|uniref:Uncharacterized protein n=1 Tax=Rosa chinensis TaxID=74649 RepID=A0A2P6QGR5_ROSCH|nr:hypothetical protein RchiOBHm_Chr5g0056901 [Rosa chinensis]